MHRTRVEKDPEHLHAGYFLKSYNSNAYCNTETLQSSYYVGSQDPLGKQKCLLNSTLHANSGAVAPGEVVEVHDGMQDNLRVPSSRIQEPNL